MLKIIPVQAGIHYYIEKASKLLDQTFSNCFVEQYKQTLSEFLMFWEVETEGLEMMREKFKFFK